MDKRLILAVAGAGKTYYLCNEIDINERNIIIAYTNQNIKNILSELSKKFGTIPEKTVVMTFHAFIYKYMIRPFDFLIGECYGVSDFVSDGVTIIEPPEPSILLSNGFRKSNPLYNKVGTLLHYIYKKKYYCEYLSKLILRTKCGAFSLVDEACKNINRFFDNVYIDEVQDFREDNWKLLLEIIKNSSNVLMVGDYYQHSVSAINNSGCPFKVKSKILNYDEYINYLYDLGIGVDNTSLITSRRCSKPVCDFVSKKLNINISSSEKNSGKVFFLTDKVEISEIMKNDKIVKLFWERADLYDCCSNTWSYSKGDTYDNVCVILTDVYSKIINDDYVCEQNPISKNKLYVALTRSKGNVFLVNKSDLDSM